MGIPVRHTAPSSQFPPARIVSWVVLALAAFCVGTADARERRPNVLLILSDMHRADYIGSVGRFPVLTPNLDRLINEGIQFTRCVSTTPVCVPARASLQTGYDPAAHRTFSPFQFMDVPRTKYLADAFGQAGYATGFSGKWHLDGSGFSGIANSYVPPGAARRGYQEWWGYGDGHDHNRVIVYDESVDPPVAVEVPGYEWEPTFQTDTFLDFARRHRDADEPWMFMLAFGPPHPPDEAPDEFVDLYSPEEIPLPPDVVAMLPLIHALGATVADVQEVLRMVYAMVSFVDHEVGRIVDGLEALGLNEDTIIVYTSDHGDMLGGHLDQTLRFHQKSVPYAAAFRVPLIVRWPGTIPAGRTTDTITTLADIPATMLDLAGLPVPWRMQGRSMRKWCLGGRGLERDAVYLHQVWRAVWTGDLLYCPTEEFRTLYDHRSDPFELTNLFEDPAYRATRTRLERRLRQLRDEAPILREFPDVCGISARLSEQVGLLHALLGTVPEAPAVEGLPLEAYLALIEEIDCSGSDFEGLREVALGAFAVNLDVYDEHDLLEGRVPRDALSALMLMSASVQQFIVDGLAAASPTLTISVEYVSVGCTEDGACIAGDSRRLSRGATEPLSGAGDADGDGLSNAQEFANVMVNGGNLRDFARAALDPTRDGIQRFGANGSCLIATAAYGTPLASELDVLREARDRFLLRNSMGAMFTDAYYRASPPIADAVARNPALKACVRLVVAGLIALLVYPLLACTLILLSLSFAMRRYFARDSGDRLAG